MYSHVNGLLTDLLEDASTVLMFICMMKAVYNTLLGIYRAR